MYLSYNQYFNVNCNETRGINVFPKIIEILFSNKNSININKSLYNELFYIVRIIAKRHIFFKQFITNYLQYVNNNKVYNFLLILTENIDQLNILYRMFYKAKLLGNGILYGKIMQRINIIIELDKKLHDEFLKFCS